MWLVPVMLHPARCRIPVGGLANEPRSLANATGRTRHRLLSTIGQVRNWIAPVLPESTGVKWCFRLRGVGKPHQTIYLLFVCVSFHAAVAESLYAVRHGSTCSTAL